MVDDYVKYTELIIAKGGQMTETVKRNMIEAYNNLGAHYAKINDIEKAKEFLNKSVAIDPTANSSYAANTLKILNGSK
jgi:Tfp pilus assembly protein PilF